MSNVIIVGDATGNVINISENPEFGYLRLKQETMKIGRGGWLRFENRTALIHGTVADLEKADYRANQKLPGKIVVTESLVPFNEKNPDRDLKVAGKTGVVLRVNDQPIYRQSFYTTDENATDELIQHDMDCRNEIREVMAAQKAVEDLGVFNDADL
jgi:hypothetical protein